MQHYGRFCRTTRKFFIGILGCNRISGFDISDNVDYYIVSDNGISFESCSIVKRVICLLIIVFLSGCTVHVQNIDDVKEEIKYLTVSNDYNFSNNTTTINFFDKRKKLLRTKKSSQKVIFLIDI